MSKLEFISGVESFPEKVTVALVHSAVTRLRKNVQITHSFQEDRR